MALHHYSLPAVTLFCAIAAPLSLPSSVKQTEPQKAHPEGILHIKTADHLPQNTIANISTQIPTAILVSIESPEAGDDDFEDQFWQVTIYEPATAEKPASIHDALINTDGTIQSIQFDQQDTMELSLLPQPVHSAILKQAPDAVIYEVEQDDGHFEVQYLSKRLPQEGHFTPAGQPAIDD